VCTYTLQATCTPAGGLGNPNASAFKKALTIGAGQQGQQKGAAYVRVVQATIGQPPTHPEAKSPPAGAAAMQPQAALVAVRNRPPTWRAQKEKEGHAALPVRSSFLTEARE
jgi:hypothetical protein